MCVCVCVYVCATVCAVFVMPQRFGMSGWSGSFKKKEISRMFNHLHKTESEIAQEKKRIGKTSATDRTKSMWRSVANVTVSHIIYTFTESCNQSWNYFLLPC